MPGHPTRGRRTSSTSLPVEAADDPRRTRSTLDAREPCLPPPTMPTSWAADTTSLRGPDEQRSQNLSISPAPPPPSEFLAKKRCAVVSMYEPPCVTRRRRESSFGRTTVIPAMSEDQMVGE